MIKGFKEFIDGANQYLGDFFKYDNPKIKKNYLCKTCDNKTCKRIKDAVKCKNHIEKGAKK